MGKLSSVQRLQANIALGQTQDMGRHQRAAIDVLESDPRFSHIAVKARACNPRRRCNLKYCPKCSVPRAGIEYRQLPENFSVTPGVADSIQPKCGGLPYNYRARGGCRMSLPYDGLPSVLIHLVTINLALVPLDGNLKGFVTRYRKYLIRLFRKWFPGAIVRGKFDIVLKLADQLEFDIDDDDDLPEELHGGVRLRQRYAMLHTHFALFDPRQSREEVRSILASEFPGRNRVCLRKVAPTKITDDGRVILGIQGYLEYTSMEKIEVAFGSESIDALIEYATLDQTWTRHNRNLSFGKRTLETENLIDPERLQELTITNQCDNNTDHDNDSGDSEQPIDGQNSIGSHASSGLRNLLATINHIALLRQERFLHPVIGLVLESICLYLIIMIYGSIWSLLFNSPQIIRFQVVELYGKLATILEFLCGNRPRGPPRLLGFSNI